MGRCRRPTNHRSRDHKAAEQNRHSPRLLGRLYLRYHHSSDRNCLECFAFCIDAADRLHYYYDALVLDERRTEKFGHLKMMAAALPTIRARVNRTLDESFFKLSPRRQRAVVIATLLDRCRFRPGARRYRRLHGSVGATTIDSSHLKMLHNCLQIRFTGKSGVDRRCDICDPTLILSFTGK